MHLFAMAANRIAALPPSVQATFWITLSGFTFTIIATAARAERKG